MSFIALLLDCAEWDVLYTTQITQKAKRYHDGVLKILSCGSLQKQVICLLFFAASLFFFFQFEYYYLFKLVSYVFSGYAL